MQPEITKFQVETATPVCTTMAELRQHLAHSRATLAAVARQHGLRLAATGTPVLGRVADPPLTDKPRYHRMFQEYGALTDGLSICGCHVHIGMPDPEVAITVSNHMRPWLPVLLALSANSPFWDERDTGYASWRYLVWGRWPSAGPPPLFESTAHYDASVHTLIGAGAAVDRAMTYWDIRLSVQHPTLELRVCDVAGTVDEAVLVAALARALAASAMRARRPPPQLPQLSLRAALWRAARDGLEGSCVDPVARQVVPTSVLVRQLLALVRPALETAGDYELVTELLDALVHRGSGANRQRRAFLRRGRLTDVVDLLTAQTAETAVTDVPLPRPPD